MDELLMFLKKGFIYGVHNIWTQKYNKSLKMWTVTSIVSIRGGLVPDFD